MFAGSCSEHRSQQARIAEFHMELHGGVVISGWELHSRSTANTMFRNKRSGRRQKLVDGGSGTAIFHSSRGHDKSIGFEWYILPCFNYVHCLETNSEYTITE